MQHAHASGISLQREAETFEDGRETGVQKFFGRQALDLSLCFVQRACARTSTRTA
jgi:hypothetical protein